MLAKRLAKKFIPGVSWQNPVVNAVLRGLDPIDAAVRRFRGLSHLPRYSIRVRSNGVEGQFGGSRFANYGRLIRKILVQHARLTDESRVLEIGCGCGRAALALAGMLRDGYYTGMDIEPVALRACAENRLIRERGFIVNLMDVRNNEYNPAGSKPADEYVFPYRDGGFDVIFLISVFTHMLPADIANYIREIARMLAPGGHCLMSAFLMDLGTQNPGLSFPYRGDGYSYHQESMPEISVGYDLAFFRNEFSRHGLVLAEDVLWGSWRRQPAVQSRTGFSQDILVFRRNDAIQVT